MYLSYINHILKAVSNHGYFVNAQNVFLYKVGNSGVIINHGAP